jgi:hypothetical protein
MSGFLTKISTLPSLLCVLHVPPISSLNYTYSIIYLSIQTNIKSRRMRWAEYVARMVEGRVAYRILVGRPEGRRPLGRPRRRWEDNIKMDLQEVGWGGHGLD